MKLDIYNIYYYYIFNQKSNQMKIFQITLLLILTSFANIYTQDFWEKTNGPDSMAISALAINSDGDIFAGADTSYGVFRSTNTGITWTNTGLREYKTTGMVIKPDGEIFLSTLDHRLHGGVFQSTDKGDTWTHLVGDTINNMGYKGPATSIIIKTNGHIFMGTLSDGVYRSTDNGGSWIQINAGLTNFNPISFTLNASEDIFVGTVGGGIFRSTNDGDIWVKKDSGLTNNQVLSLCSSNGFIYAGTSGDGVFRSMNNGENWSSINQGLSGEGLYIRSLVVNSNGNIFAGTAGGVYRSNDNGDSWLPINQGLSNTNVYSLAINSTGIIYAGSSGGIFRTINSTLPVELTSFAAKTIDKDKVKLNWKTETEVNNYGFDVERNTPLDPLSRGETGTSSLVSARDDYHWEKIGFVQGNGNSNSPKEYSFIDKNPIGGNKFLYRLRQVDNDGKFTYSDAVEVEILPTQYELSQNFPNPFNPVTKIRYTIPAASLNPFSKRAGTLVILKVYDELGNEVATLVNEEKPAGNYEINFNANNLSSGVYYYRIIAGNYNEVKKMILLK